MRFFGTVASLLERKSFAEKDPKTRARTHSPAAGWWLTTRTARTMPKTNVPPLRNVFSAHSSAVVWEEQRLQEHVHAREEFIQEVTDPEQARILQSPCEGGICQFGDLSGAPENHSLNLAVVGVYKCGTDE